MSAPKTRVLVQPLERPREVVIFTPKNPKQFKTVTDAQGRVCTSCGEFKVWELFNVASKSYTGRTAMCKSCKNSKKHPNRDYKKEKYSAKKHKASLKKLQPYLVKARAIRSSLLNRARKFPDIRQTTPTIEKIKAWLEGQTLVCYYSGEEVSLWEMHIDHKIPPFRGGDNGLANLCIASAKMNSSKGQMTEREFKSLLKLISTWQDKGEKLLIRLRQGFM